MMSSGSKFEASMNRIRLVEFQVFINSTNAKVLKVKIIVVYKIPYRRTRAWPRPGAREQRYLA